MSASVVTTRDEWLAQRATGVGGSDASAVMGCNPYKSTYALWTEKAGRVPSDIEESDAMEWGKRLEPVIASKYIEVTGRTVQVFASAAPEIIRHATRPYMLGSLDGDVIASERPSPGILEIKTTGIARDDDWEEEAPLHHQVQLQHYMSVTGRSWGSFAVLIGGQKFRWYDVERNDTFIAALEARCEWFWGLVERQEAPPVDDTESTAAALKSLYAVEKGGAVDLSFEGVAWLEELEAAKAAIADAEARKRAAENQIRAAIGAATVGVVPGRGSFSLKTQRREEHMVKASEFRVLRFSTKGGK